MDLNLEKETKTAENQTSNPEYSPNFLDERSQLTEETFPYLLEYGEGLELSIGDIEASREEIMELISTHAPERWSLVTSELEEKNIQLDTLDKEDILDKFLGIDSILVYEDKKHPVDLTSGSATTIKNKRKKMESLRPLYSQLGLAEPIVCTWKESSLSEETLIDLLSQLEEQERAKKLYEHRKELGEVSPSKKKEHQHNIYDIRLG